MDINHLFGLLFILLDICLINCETQELVRSACYGTHNNFLNLECPWRDKIKIHKVYQGAKPTSLECPYPTDQNSYKEECCVPAKDDCMFEVKNAEPNSYEIACNGKSSCKQLTMWSGTTGLCDPKKFNSLTNFMKITYSCISGQRSSTTPPPTTTTTTTLSPPKTYVTPAKMTARPGPRTIDNLTTTLPASNSSTIKKLQQPTTASVNAPGSATKAISTTTATGYRFSSDKTIIPSNKADAQTEDSFAFTTGMMGGMAAAIIGLILTIFGFVFYWGRKRRHMVMTKPQTSVWDFLLSQNINFRPFRRGGLGLRNHGKKIINESD